MQSNERSRSFVFLNIRFLKLCINKISAHIHRLKRIRQQKESQERRTALKTDHTYQQRRYPLYKLNDDVIWALFALCFGL